MVIVAYRRKLHGGDYEKDATVTSMEGIDIKHPDDVVVAFPGATMSAAEYKEYMARREMSRID